MVYTQTWVMNCTSLERIMEDISINTCMFPKLFSHMELPEDLGVLVSGVPETSSFRAVCDSPCLSSADYKGTPTVVLHTSSSLHVCIRVSICAGACIASVRQHIELLLSRLRMGLVYCTGSLEPSLCVYTYLLEWYPCLPFAEQLPVGSNVSDLQRHLGPEKRYTVWMASNDERSEVLLRNRFLSMPQFHCGVSLYYGVDGLTAAQYIDAAHTSMDVRSRLCFVTFRQNLETIKS